MSVARFIADQRTHYGVPHAFSCRVLAVSEAWFYKWIKAPTTARGQRRALLDEAVREAFKKSGASYGSPRVHEDLIDPELPHPELAELAADEGAEVVQLRAQHATEEPVSDVTDEVLSEEPVCSGALREDPDALLDRLSGPERLAAGLRWKVSVNTVQARQVISAWIEEFYNPRRRHSTLSMRSPVAHEQALAAEALSAENAA